MWRSRVGSRLPAKTAGALLVVALLSVARVSAAPVEPIYPGALWDKAASPEALGYSTAGLREAREYTKTIQTAAVMIAVGGQVLDEWGETTTKFNVHSIRKSFLSALYGIHAAEEPLDLSRTVRDLGIDDKEPSLTPIEKGATLRQLLQARSGVYHPALYETEGMKARRPARSSHEPGTFWYYNNWDFNALGTIFRNLTRTDIFQEFKRRIADPIGMQDFNPATDGTYVTGDDSVHAAYPFRMTARDMARFGLLFLRNGRWKGLSVVPESWVKESLTSYSDAGPSGGYGYLWWIAVDGKHLPGVSLPAGSYSARGAGGHYILVIPAYDMVIVHRVNTDVRGASVSGEQFGNLVRLILAARTSTTPSSDE
jgi:CubicO group peptidase (beta-lactamase class C family)